MSYRVYQFPVTVPAGTAEASPQTTDLAMPPGTVRKVRIRVPPGPSGEVGFGLAAAGQRFVPWGGTAWLVADNEIIEWAPSNAISSGAWQLQAYNTGNYDHTLYVTFELDPPGATPGASDVTLLDLVGLTG